MKPIELVKELTKRLSRSSTPVRSVIIFGSATRPQDYVEELSDIDVAVICDGISPKTREIVLEGAREVSPHLSPIALDRSGLETEFSIPSDLAFLIQRGEPILLDERTGSIIQRRIRPTKGTAKGLVRGATIASKMAFRSYQRGELKEALNHTYHALRHGVRYRALEAGKFPISDAEVLQAAGEKERKHLQYLISLRYDFKNAIKNPEEIADAILKSDRLIDSLLGLGETVPLEHLTRMCYARVICYPKPNLDSLRRRIDQIKELGLEAIEFTGGKVVNDRFVLGKGCVSVVVIGLRKRKRFALKILRTDSGRESTEHEVGMQEIANTVGVGPMLYGHGRDVILMELIKGTHFPDWLKSEGLRDVRTTRRTLRELLEKCWRLDSVGLDHGELSRAPKHIIVDKAGNPRFVDFETSSNVRRVGNVTSIAQYLFIRGEIARIIQGVVGKIEREELVAALRAYKARGTRQDLERIIDVCHLARE